MADPIGALRIELSADAAQFIENLRKADRAAKQSETTFSRVVDGIKHNWLGLTAAAYAAEEALAKVWSMAKRAADFEESQERLNGQLQVFKTTADQLVPKMIAMAQGQLSFEEATKLASKALAGGFAPSEIENVTKLSEVLSDLKGIGVAEAFDTITQAIITGRTNALKSIGIYIDLDKEVEKVAGQYGIATAKIDEAEKAQIRLNAVMRELPAIFAKFNSEAPSHADQLVSIEKKWDNLTLAASRYAKTLIIDVIESMHDLNALRGGMFPGEVGKEKLPGGGAATGAKPKGFDTQISGPTIAEAKEKGKALASLAEKARNEKFGNAVWDEWNRGQNKAVESTEQFNAGLEATRQKFSPVFATQAELLQMSAKNYRDDTAQRIADDKSLADSSFQVAAARFQADQSAFKSNNEVRAARLAQIDADETYQIERSGKTATEIIAIQRNAEAQRIGVAREFPTFFDQQLQMMKDSAGFAFANITSQFSQGIASMIVDGARFKDIMLQIWRTLLSTVIQTLIQMGIQAALTATTNEAVKAAETKAWTALEGSRVAATVAANKAISASTVLASAAAIGVGQATLLAMQAIVTAAAGVLLAAAAAAAVVPGGQPIAGALIVAAASMTFAATAAIAASQAVFAGAATAAAAPILAGAKGGNMMVNSPTMFLAGEAGMEHVQVTPMPGGGRHGGSGRLEIPVIVRGREIARAVVPDFWDQVQRQTGAPVRA